MRCNLEASSSGAPLPIGSHLFGAPAVTADIGGKGGGVLDCDYSVGSLGLPDIALAGLCALGRVLSLLHSCVGGICTLDRVILLLLLQRLCVRWTRRYLLLLRTYLVEAMRTLARVLSLLAV